MTRYLCNDETIVGVTLAFPRDDTIQEVLSALRDEDLIIKRLTCGFTDGNFVETQELRDNILIGIVSGNMQIYNFQNFCRDQEKHNRCFDFFLQCLSEQQQQTKHFGFLSSLPFTVVEANKLSAAITSTNDNIDSINFFETKRTINRGTFREEGTFEPIFEAVLNNNAIKTLSLFLNSISLRRIIERECFGNSTLSTNVTLQNIHLGSPVGEFWDDEGMNHFANILKVNKGLHSIIIWDDMITNVGLKYLLDSLQYNTTLLKLKVKIASLPPPAVRIKSEEEIKERIFLQSKINSLVQVNGFWKHCNLKNRSTRKGDKKWTNMDMVPVNVYPNLLETLAKKPVLLFLFLQKKNPVLFDVISEQRTQPRQRRSMRVLKRRRITKELAK